MQMLNAHAGRTSEPSIRPAEAVPYVVSDLAVVRALQARHARKALSIEKLRAAKLVALVAFVRAGETEMERGAEPWTVEFPLEIPSTAAALGLQPRQMEEAIGHLRGAGVFSEVQTAGTVRYRLSEAVYERSGTGDALDWPAILARLEGEPAALLVARAFADLLPAPFAAWSTVRLTALGEHTGYGTITARKGKDVLVELGIVEENSQAGQTSGFRFTDFARGRAPSPSAASRAESTTPVMEQPGSAASLSARVTATAVPTTEPGEVSLQVGGLELRVPRGTVVRVEVDRLGRQTIRVGEHLVVGPL